MYVEVAGLRAELGRLRLSDLTNGSVGGEASWLGELTVDAALVYPLSEGEGIQAFAIGGGAAAWCCAFGSAGDRRPQPAVVAGVVVGTVAGGRSGRCDRRTQSALVVGARSRRPWSVQRGRYCAGNRRLQSVLMSAAAAGDVAGARGRCVACDRRSRSALVVGAASSAHR